MAIGTTSVPQVIDALLHKIRGLSVCAQSTGVLVIDGPLPGTATPDTFVTIGGDVDPTADGTQDWMSLGAANGVAPAKDEKYLINGYIFSSVGGEDDGSGTQASDGQKTARDNCYAIFTAIETALRNDPVLIAETTVFTDGKGLQTGWCGIYGHRLNQTDLEDPRSGMGRYAEIHFDIAVFKRLRSA